MRRASPGRGIPTSRWRVAVVERYSILGFVTAIFARRMIQAAGESVDGPALLRSVGLEPDEPLDVAEMISDDAYYDLLERIASEMDSAHELPLRVGPLMRPDDYGALGLAWKSAPTVRSSLERVERYCRFGPTI